MRSVAAREASTQRTKAGPLPWSWNEHDAGEPPSAHGGHGLQTNGNIGAVCYRSITEPGLTDAHMEPPCAILAFSKYLINREWTNELMDRWGKNCKNYYYVIIIIFISAYSNTGCSCLQKWSYGRSNSCIFWARGPRVYVSSQKPTPCV